MRENTYYAALFSTNAQYPHRLSKETSDMSTASTNLHSCGSFCCVFQETLHKHLLWLYIPQVGVVCFQILSAQSCFGFKVVFLVTIL